MELEGNIPSAIEELETGEKFAPDVKTTYYRLGTLFIAEKAVNTRPRTVANFSAAHRTRAECCRASDAPQ